MANCSNWDSTFLSVLFPVGRREHHAAQNQKNAGRHFCNHREAIAAMDFFAVPTIAFGLLYGFFVIGHGRRRILHFAVTRHPTSCWVAQQLREAFPYDLGQRYLIFGRVEDWRGAPQAWPIRLLPVSSGSASLAEP